MKKTIWITMEQLQEMRRREGNIDNIETEGKLTHSLPLGMGYIEFGVPQNALLKKKGRIKLTILKYLVLTMG